MKSVKMFICLVFGICFIVPPVLANDAVSMNNYKMEGLYGKIDGETAKAFAGSASFPVGMSYGIQIDGLAGRINPDEVYGLGLHTFWRDSNVGLLGLAASSAEAYDTEVRRIGFEGEYYYNQFTISGYLGHQDGDVDNSGYAGIIAGYYLCDDLLASAGAHTSDGFQRYDVGVEYQTSAPGLTIYGNLAMGEDDYEHVYFGLRYYFGADEKTLIKRHREDDPLNNIFGGLIGILHSINPPCFCRHKD